MSDQALIDQHLATKGVIKCPPAFVGVTESAHDAVVSAEDREAIRRHEEALRERQQMEWLVTTRSPKAVGPLADEIRASLRKRSEAGKAAYHRKQAAASAARAAPTLTKSAASLVPAPRAKRKYTRRTPAPQAEMRLTAVSPPVAAARVCGPEHAAAQVGAASVTEAAQTNAPPLMNGPPAWQSRATAIVERLDALSEALLRTERRVCAVLGQMKDLQAAVAALQARPDPAPPANEPPPRPRKAKAVWNPKWAVNPKRKPK